MVVTVGWFRELYLQNNRLTHIASEAFTNLASLQVLALVLLYFSAWWISGKMEEATLFTGALYEFCHHLGDL
jgi:hypothetical protein